jgi:HAD superfamily hydrolase (TIGR01490 family)
VVRWLSSCTGEPKMSIAFFDLDRTLLATNSATGWIKRELRLGHLSRVDALKAASWVGLYGLGLGAMEDTIRRAVQGLSGVEEAEIIARTLAFWDEEVQHQTRPGARAVVDAHRAQGHHLVLLTSSSPYLSAPAAAVFGIDEVRCNHFVVQDGRFTGETVEPLCYGAGKLVHAQASAEVHGVDLQDCSFYTDSWSDVSVMDKVGRPVAVHPDQRLMRYARKKGWEIVDWGG